MKLTKSRLQQIIKEELDNLGEGFFGDMFGLTKSHWQRSNSGDPATGWKLVQQGKEDVDKRIMKMFKTELADYPNGEEILKVMGSSSPDGNYGTYLMAKTYDSEKVRKGMGGDRQKQDALMNSAFLDVVGNEFADFKRVLQDNDERAREEAIAQKKKEAEQAEYRARRQWQKAQQAARSAKESGDKEAQERCKRRTGMGSKGYYDGAPNHQRKIDKEYSDCLKELSESQRKQRKRKRKK